MTEYIYFSTYIEFKVPTNGGTPIITKKFTKEMTSKGTKTKRSLKTKPTKETTTENEGTITL